MACAFAVFAVLVVAAVSKFRSPSATRGATVELGVSPRLASLVAPVELGTAALLLVRPSVGAVCAVVLLTAFTVVLGRVVRSGRTVRCGCFGAANSSPVNALTLLRNASLIAASAVAGFAPAATRVQAGEVVASALVALGIVSAGLLLHALADVRRVTGAVFPSARSGV